MFHGYAPLHSWICSTLHVKRIASGSLASSYTPNFGTICPAIPKKRKMGADVRTYVFSPRMTCGKRIANGNAINFSKVRPAVSERRKRGGGVSARVHVCMCRYPTHGLGNRHRYLVSKNTSTLFTIGQAIPQSKLSDQFLHPSGDTR